MSIKIYEFYLHPFTDSLTPNIARVLMLSKFSNYEQPSCCRTSPVLELSPRTTSDTVFWDTWNLQSLIGEENEGSPVRDHLISKPVEDKKQ